MNRELKDLYRVYEMRPLKPELSLEIACDFVLDLINVFGDKLNQATPLRSGWRTFAPFEFIVDLNQALGKFKQGGYESLDESERTLLNDHAVLIGSLVRAALKSHPDTFPDQEHFQIPDKVADELMELSETS